MTRRCSVIRMPLAAHSASMFALDSAMPHSVAVPACVIITKEAPGAKSAAFIAWLRSREVAAQHQGGSRRASRPRIVTGAASDLAERIAGVEPARGYVVVIDLEKDRAHAEPGKPAHVQVEEPAREPAPLVGAGDGDREDFGLPGGNARDDEPDRLVSEG